MGNLSCHKDLEAREMIEQTGALILDLPPYSPDFNPIEQMWSKIKEFLRKAAARSIDALVAAIAEALKTITDADIVAWFEYCGCRYSQT